MSTILACPPTLTGSLAYEYSLSKIMTAFAISLLYETLSDSSFNKSCMRLNELLFMRSQAHGSHSLAHLHDEFTNLMKA